MNDNKIKAAWEKLNPSEESKQNIMNKIVRQNHRKLRFPFKVMLVAAVICILSIASVVAYTSHIREFAFGGSRARQVEYVANPNTTRYVHYFHNGVYNRSDAVDSYFIRIETPGLDPIIYQQPEFTTIEEALLYAPFVSFLTMEEANHYAPFTISEPSFVPENIRLDRILLLPNDDDTYAHVAHLRYFNENNILSFWIKQLYVGPEGYFVYESEHSKEKVMIGDIEALFVERPRWYGNPGEMHRELMWISDGVFFSLGSNDGIDRNGNGLGLDFETMVDIAKSIR